MRKVGIAMAVVGVILIAAAALLKFVLVPGQKELPSDMNKTRHYAGTLNVALNAQAIASGDLSAVFLRNVPVTVDRNVKTLKTDGDKATVQDLAVAKGPTGEQLGGSDFTYVVDRKSMQTVGLVDGTTVTAAKGLSVTFPFAVGKHDHTSYVPEVRAEVPSLYSGTAKVDGLETYIFKTKLDATKITDPKTLSTLPSSLPKSLLATVAATLDLTAAQKQQMTQLFALLPDPVPIGYTLSRDSTSWVEPVTGMVVRTERNDVKSAMIDAEGLPNVPLTAVSDITYAQTSQSVSDAVSDAKDTKGKLALFGTTLPIVGLVVGLLLLGGGLFMARRRPPTPPEVPAEQEPVLASR